MATVTSWSHGRDAKVRVVVLCALTFAALLSESTVAFTFHLGPRFPVRGKVGPGRAAPRQVSGTNVDLFPTPGRLSETSIAINPTNPNNIVAGSNIITSLPPGAQATFTSVDGGLTWVYVGQSTSTTTGHSFLAGTDPFIEFDAQGNVYYCYLLVNISSTGGTIDALGVTKSTNGGLTWGDLVPIVDHTGETTPPVEDHPAMAIDRNPGSQFRNTIYVSWAHFNATQTASRILASHSSDGGATWSSPLQVDQPGTNNVEFAVPAVGPNGEVYVVWTDYGVGQLRVAKSIDGGQTFGPPINVAPFSMGLTSSTGDYAIPAQPDRRIVPSPSIAVDPAGNVFVQWNDLGPNGPTDVDILLAKSADGGQTWHALGQTPKRVNNDPSTSSASQFMGWMAIDPIDRSINISYYDTRDDPNNQKTNYYLSRSTDGGHTFVDAKVTTAQSDESVNNPNRDVGNNYGDYTGIAARGGVVFPCWTDTRTGTENIFAARLQPSGAVVVTNTSDNGTGSLRAAIGQVNAASGTGPVLIQFNIPTNDPGFANNVFTVRPASPLPPITRVNTTIDGASEINALGGTNSNPNGPPIVITGTNLPGAPTGLSISAEGCTVGTLIINGFAGSGISLSAHGCRVTGCYLGTDASGTTAVANGTGILLNGATGCTIGGAGATDGNLISGNATQGLAISGGSANTVQGNTIGVNRLKTGGDPLGNGSFGILIQSSSTNNLIGGATSGAGNLIAYNPRGGILLGASTSDQCTGNHIQQNSIFSNSGRGGLGIDLASDGVTPNDVGDGDTGPNNLQNFPVITSAQLSGSTLTVSGILDTPNPQTATVDLFGNANANPSGYGEGGTWLGSATPDAKGNWNAAVTLPSGASFFGHANDSTNPKGHPRGQRGPLPTGPMQFITATATDANGNSSEFSRAHTIGGTVFSITYPQGLNLVSIPRDLTQFSNNDLAALFELPPDNLKLAEWDVTNQNYFLFNQPGFTTQNLLGRGLWAKTTQAVTISVGGQPAATPFQWNLSHGWNLLGNLGDTDVQYVVTGIHILQNGTALGTIQDVFKSNILSPAVDPFVWIYDNASAGYQLVTDTSANLVNVSAFTPAIPVKSALPKGAGCWVFARGDNLSVQFDASLFKGLAGKAAQTLRSSRAVSPRMDLNHWALQLSAQMGEARDGSAILGVNGSTRGMPAFLAQKPPVPAIGSQFVRVAFEQDSGATDLAYDLRSSMNKDTCWNVVITGSDPEAEVELQWPRLATLPKSLRFYLLDLATGKRQFMNTTTACRFRLDNGVLARKFRLQASIDQTNRLLLQNVNARALRSLLNPELQLLFSLNRDANVSVRLVNPAGRVLKEMQLTSSRTGLNSALLILRDRLGRLPARGVYLVEIVARTDDGEEVKSIKMVAIR